MHHNLWLYQKFHVNLIIAIHTQYVHACNNHYSDMYIIYMELRLFARCQPIHSIQVVQINNAPYIATCYEDVNLFKQYISSYSDQTACMLHTRCQFNNNNAP